LRTVIGIDAQSLPAIHLLHDGADIVLGDGEQHRDRLQLRHHDNAVRLSGFHKVADIDLAQTDAAGHWRRDLRVLQIDLRLIDARLIGLDRAFGLLRRGDGGCVGLRRDSVQFDEISITLHVDARFLQRGLIFLQGADRLIDRSLEGARIDFGQHVPGLDHLAFFDVEFEQLPAHLRADGDGGKRRDRSQRVERNVDVAADDTRNANWHRASAKAAAAGIGIRVRLDGPDHEQQEQQPHHDPEYALTAGNMTVRPIAGVRYAAAYPNAGRAQSALPLCTLIVHPKILSISISYWRICLHRPKALLRNSAPSTRDQGSRSTQPGRAQIATPFQYQTGHGEICRKCRDFLCAAVIWTREPPAQPG